MAGGMFRSFQIVLLLSIPYDGWFGCEIEIFTDTIHVLDGIIATTEKLVSQCDVSVLVRLPVFGILQHCRNGNRGSYRVTDCFTSKIVDSPEI